MKVLVLLSPERPLAYPTVLDDLANHGVYATAIDTHRWGFLQPTVIARHLRHGDYEAVIVLTDKQLQTARQAVELSGTEAKVTKMPELPAPAVYDFTQNDQLTDIDKRKPIYLLTMLAEARAAVEGFAATASADARLRILGAGKARMVMPVVQLARKLEVDKRIDWLGDDYNLKKECENCTAFVAGGRPLNTIEASLCAAGVPCVSPSDFGKTIERTDWCTREFHVKQTLSHLLALRQQ